MGAVACGAENNLRKTCLIPGTVVGAVILDKGLYAPKYMYLFVLLFFLVLPVASGHGHVAYPLCLTLGVFFLHLFGLLSRIFYPELRMKNQGGHGGGVGCRRVERSSLT